MTTGDTTSMQAHSARMASVTYSAAGGQTDAAYAVAIDGRPAARIERTGRRWQLRYDAGTLTLASLAAVTQLVERFADKIAPASPPTAAPTKSRSADVPAAPPHKQRSLRNLAASQALPALGSAP